MLQRDTRGPTRTTVRVVLETQKCYKSEKAVLVSAAFSNPKIKYNLLCFS